MYQFHSVTTFSFQGIRTEIYTYEYVFMGTLFNLICTPVNGAKVDRMNKLKCPIRVDAT